MLGAPELAPKADLKGKAAEARIRSLAYQKPLGSGFLGGHLGLRDTPQPFDDWYSYIGIQPHPQTCRSPGIIAFSSHKIQDLNIAKQQDLVILLESLTMLSTLPYLELVASFYATIFVGFGILWFVNIPMALSFFELSYPKTPSQKGPETKELIEAKKTIDAFAIVYGVRDIFMGAAIYAASLFGTRIALGWILVAAGSVAFTDGAVCKFMVGKGEMNHWSYAPVLVLLGSVILGALDWIPL